MLLVVDEVRRLSPVIVTFTLRGPDGEELPPASPGAHLAVEVPCGGGKEWRHWSLVDFDGSLAVPRAYRLAVRLEEASRGGSRFVHETLAPGHRLRVLPPKNDFPLDMAQDDVVLIAGGIGITPLSGMAAALARAGKRFVLHYSGRTRVLLAFVPELRAICGDSLCLHADDDVETRLDVPALMAGLRPGRPIYVCGPRGMIERDHRRSDIARMEEGERSFRAVQRAGERVRRSRVRSDVGEKRIDAFRSAGQVDPGSDGECRARAAFGLSSRRVRRLFDRGDRG